MAAINCRLFPFVLQQWWRVGANYAVVIGYQPMTYSWGLDLAWGRRDLLGETMAPGESRYADRISWTVRVSWK